MTYHDGGDLGVGVEERLLEHLLVLRRQGVLSVGGAHCD